MTSAMNDALAFFDKHIHEDRITGTRLRAILAFGKWRPLWKQDLCDRYQLQEVAPADAVLSLYEDAALKSKAYIKHMGLYLEVTKDEITPARNRMTQAGYNDVTVLVDDNQRYILARKQGR